MYLVIYILAAVLGSTALVISGYSFLFFLVGMLPTIVACMIDRRLSRAASNTIGAFNLTGVFPYLLDLWNSGDAASNKARDLLGDVHIWLIIYSSAALGLLLIWGLPTLMGNFFVFRSKKKIEYYREEQMELYHEWQFDIDKSTFREYLAHHKTLDKKE
ncbi:hypothetical protein [Rickettsiales endosymbiont of Stachyamoeba lipophora]|uniref:hypothetical protein n=1 Tax=Rickettsiales endosymbiont of Stachyamoeba lipophora TaxID=2486578 RepID=UPI000F64BB95|nr:hypothetical protein [Rickettsiales endosymbiont of Stachyamoeba lipophora]AZL16233.1 hypothetical protein EF513_06800 [Rickettsiales endosymbiont of Stachyamoeba lipophora]